MKLTSSQAHKLTFSHLLTNLLSLFFSIRPSHPSPGVTEIASSDNVNPMMTTEIPFSVLLSTEKGQTVPINSYDFSTVSKDIRQQWAGQVIKYLQPGRSGLEAIRACTIVLNINGTADVRAEPTEPVDGNRFVYPLRFRIPSATVEENPLEESGRAEMFAFGSLLYHIYSGHKPFHKFPDGCVEARFANAEIPNDVLDLDQWPMILSSWSAEFARDLHDSISSNPILRDRVLNHVKSHPYLSALQASGLLLSAASLGAPLILGAAGFSAIGPVAGSVAAAWQSTIPLAQAGSLFTWCQSAAMGGAAASGIFAVGAVGATAAAGATLAEFVTSEAVGDITEEQIREMYEKAFRRGPKDKEKL